MLVDNSSLNRKLEAYTVLITFVFTSEMIFQFAISILRSFAYRYAEIIGFPLVFYLGSYKFLPTSWSLVPSVFVCLFVYFFKSLQSWCYWPLIQTSAQWLSDPVIQKLVPPSYYTLTVLIILKKILMMHLFTCFSLFLSTSV